MDIINSVYDSVSVYRSIVIVACTHESDKIAELLINNDYPVTFDVKDKNARVLIATNDMMSQVPNRLEYNVIFVSKKLLDEVDINQYIHTFENLKLVAFIDI